MLTFGQPSHKQVLLQTWIRSSSCTEFGDTRHRLQWRLGGHVEFPRRSLRRSPTAPKAALRQTRALTRRPWIRPLTQRSQTYNHTPVESCYLCTIPPAGSLPRHLLGLINQSVTVSTIASSPSRVFHASLPSGTCLAARLSLASSQTIGGPGDVAMGAMEATLAALRDASIMAGRIPFISPVASLLLQVFTMRDASVSSSRRCHVLPVS